MKKTVLFAIVFTLSNLAFAGEVDLSCQPENSPTWMSIKLFHSQPGQESNEVSEFQIRSANNQILMQVTNANFQSQMNSDGILTSVRGDLGRSGSFTLQVNMDGTGQLQSSVFAPGMNFPNGIRANCRQSSPRPALTGSN